LGSAPSLLWADLAHMGVSLLLSSICKAVSDCVNLQENTTKLSKLCLGTLNELEKLEKQQQEKQADPRTEDKIRR
jgi:hypothetical protein